MSGAARRLGCAAAFTGASLLLASLLFLLRPLSPASADSLEISGFVERSAWIWYLRWPLTHLAAQGMHRWLGLPGADCLAVLSSIAGGLFLSTVLVVARRSPLILLVLASSVSLTLTGHVEVYAWPHVVLLWLLLLAPRHLSGEMRLTALVALFALGCLMHMLLAFYAPALVWLAWAARRRALRDGRPRAALDRDLAQAFTLAVAFFAIITIAPLLLQAAGLDNDLERIVPLTMPAVPHSSNQVTLFEPAHFGQMALFLIIGAPLGLPLTLLRMRRVWSSDELRFTSLAALCGLVFLVMWHPDMGWRGDWDLFSHPGLVINVLAWRLWSQNRAHTESQRRRE